MVHREIPGSVEPQLYSSVSLGRTSSPVTEGVAQSGRLVWGDAAQGEVVCHGREAPNRGVGSASHWRRSDVSKASPPSGRSTWRRCPRRRSSPVLPWQHCHSHVGRSVPVSGPSTLRWSTNRHSSRTRCSHAARVGQHLRQRALDGVPRVALKGTRSRGATNHQNAMSAAY